MSCLMLIQPSFHLFGLLVESKSPYLSSQKIAGYPRHGLVRVFFFAMDKVTAKDSYSLMEEFRRIQQNCVTRMPISCIEEN